jgi:hypothetical protein
MISGRTLMLRTVDELAIDDERSFRHVGLYADLKEVLRRARYPFRILPRSRPARADRALLLNLTFWSADAGGDILVDRRGITWPRSGSVLAHPQPRCSWASRSRAPSTCIWWVARSVTRLARRS